MNPHPRTTAPRRIEAIDALRGFALLGIVLLHNIDHFDLGNPVVSGPAFLQQADRCIQEFVFFVFGGKSYAMFALLFGFSFYAQYKSWSKKGARFAGRFAWRMLLLLGFGVLHVTFYSGEILSCYAIVGLMLIPLRSLSDRWFLALAIFFALEPWEMYRLIHALADPPYVPASQSPDYYLEAAGIAQQDTSFWETARVNLSSGMINAHLFAWYSGRYLQTFSLFLIGALLGRRKLFVESPESVKFWLRTLPVAAVGFLLFFCLRSALPDMPLRGNVRGPMMLMATMWGNLAFMFVLVASFMLLWFRTPLHTAQSVLAPYGRMSLTNYVTSSVLGSAVYYGYGLGMYSVLGPALSLLTGATVFTIQLFFSRWWLRRHSHGPLEGIWYRLTWLGWKPQK